MYSVRYFSMAFGKIRFEENMKNFSDKVFGKLSIRINMFGEMYRNLPTGKR